MRLAAGLAALSVAFIATSAPAEQAELALSATCRVEPGSGRQVCRVKMAARRGRLGWADLLVRSAP